MRTSSDNVIAFEVENPPAPPPEDWGWQPDDEHDAPRADRSPRRQNRPPAALDTIDLSAVPLDDVPPRRWIVHDVIPDRNVTDLSGDGGLGKSLLALQLGIAMTAGRDWIGHMPEPGSFVYVSCEDEPDEILRRRNSILIGMDLVPNDITGFHLIDLTSADTSELAGPGKDTAFGLTDLFERLKATVRVLRPKCVVLDTRADVFGGNELARVQVRQFVRGLRRLCLEHDLAIILVSHPSVGGMASGSGQSGSTAWGNSVRSRLYLTTPTSDGEVEVDHDLRILSNKKANYGPRGMEIVLRWKEGLFRLEGGGLTGLDRANDEREVELRFLRLLADLKKEGRHANASSGPNYAPKLLAAKDGKITKAAFRRAMERLFTRGDIVNTSSGQSTAIDLTDSGMAAIRDAF